MSAGLTAELRREHTLIVEHLTQAAACGLHTEAGRAALRAARAALLAHLEREDRMLYPALTEAARHEPYLETLLGIFRQQTQEVSREVLAFFKRYEAGGNGEALERDFDVLKWRLLGRIRVEEDQLYPQYDRVSAAAPPPRKR